MLVSQRLDPLEELLEHSRTSEYGEGMESQFDCAMFTYVAQNSPCWLDSSEEDCLHHIMAYTT